MRKKIKLTDKKRSFYIMNRDARYFRGLLAGDIVWTDIQNDAKTFDHPSKIKMLKRWKPEEKMEIVYCNEI